MCLILDSSSVVDLLPSLHMKNLEGPTESNGLFLLPIVKRTCLDLILLLLILLLI
jgi:hypothetical protein